MQAVACRHGVQRACSCGGGRLRSFLPLALLRDRGKARRVSRVAPAARALPGLVTVRMRDKAACGPLSRPGAVRLVVPSGAHQPSAASAAYRVSGAPSRKARVTRCRSPGCAHPRLGPVRAAGFEGRHERRTGLARFAATRPGPRGRSRQGSPPESQPCRRACAASRAVCRCRDTRIILPLGKVPGRVYSTRAPIVSQLIRPRHRSRRPPRFRSSIPASHCRHMRSLRAVLMVPRIINHRRPPLCGAVRRSARSSSDLRH